MLNDGLMFPVWRDANCPFLHRENHSKQCTNNEVAIATKENEHLSFSSLVTCRKDPGMEQSLKMANAGTRVMEEIEIVQPSTLAHVGNW